MSSINESIVTIYQTTDILVQINETSLEFHARNSITGLMEPVLIIAGDSVDELHRMGKRILSHIERKL